MSKTMNQEPVKEQINQEPAKKKRFIGKFLGFLTISITILWALVEYLLPDPIVYFYSIWRPEYVLILMSALVFTLSLSIYIWAYLKNKYLFFIASFFIYILSSFSYFVIGREYYSADFGGDTPSVTLNQGSLYFRGVEFEHIECERKADTIGCDFMVINNRSHASLSMNSWKMVMEDGAIFTDYRLSRASQSTKRNYINLDLPQGAKAKIKVVFYEVPTRYNKILSLGLEVNNSGNRQDFSFKNLNVLN